MLSKNLMDYSMLVGVERRLDGGGDDSFESVEDDMLTDIGDFELLDASEPSKNQFEHGARVVHFSIIDYLQEWNCNKKSERLMKTYILNKNGA